MSGERTLRARACLGCKEYMIVHPNSQKNATDLEIFRGRHAAHAVVTVDVNEVKRDRFKRFRAGEREKV
jgi:hypothetical protein